MSFMVASFLPRLGYKKAMLVALAIVTAACVAMPLLPTPPRATAALSEVSKSTDRALKLGVSTFAMLSAITCWRSAPAISGCLLAGTSATATPRCARGTRTSPRMRSRTSD